MSGLDRLWQRPRLGQRCLASSDLCIILRLFNFVIRLLLVMHLSYRISYQAIACRHARRFIVALEV
jgi:hypothetical protein